MPPMKILCSVGSYYEYSFLIFIIAFFTIFQKRSFFLFFKFLFVVTMQIYGIRIYGFFLSGECLNLILSVLGFKNNHGLFVYFLQVDLSVTAPSRERGLQIKTLG